MTDVALPRAALQASLTAACAGSFNAMSVDSDTSTSDTVVLLSSERVPLAAAGGAAAFDAALADVCARLAEDIVRNGEGVQHVIRVAVRGAPDAALARAVGKAVVNSPLFKCAVAGNDPNVGRLVAAVGKCIGARDGPPLDLRHLRMRMGGVDIFRDGAFALTGDVEQRLVAHMRQAQLWGACARRPPPTPRRPAARARARATCATAAASPLAMPSQSRGLSSPAALLASTAPRASPMLRRTYHMRRPSPSRRTSAPSKLRSTSASAAQRPPSSAPTSPTSTSQPMQTTGHRKVRGRGWARARGV